MGVVVESEHVELVLTGAVLDGAPSFQCTDVVVYLVQRLSDPFDGVALDGSCIFGVERY